MFALGMHVRREKKKEDKRKSIRRSATLPPSRPSTAIQYPSNLLQMVAAKTAATELTSKSQLGDKQNICLSDDNLNCLKKPETSKVVVRKISEGSKSVASTASTKEKKACKSRSGDKSTKKQSTASKIDPNDIDIEISADSNGNCSSQHSQVPFLTKLSKRCSKFRLNRQQSFT